jgi:hypothetical protein
MEVAGRGLEVGVSEQCLDDAHVCVLADDAAGEGATPAATVASWADGPRPHHHLSLKRGTQANPPEADAPIPADCGGNAQTCADSDENIGEERRSHAACGPTWRVILAATPRANEFQTPPTASYRPHRPQNYLDFAGQHPFNDPIGSTSEARGDQGLVGEAQI